MATTAVAGRAVPVTFRVHDGDQLVSDVAVLDVDVVPTAPSAHEVLFRYRK